MDRDWKIIEAIEKLNIPYVDEVAFCKHMEIRAILATYFL